MTKTFSFNVYVTEPVVDFDEAAERLYSVCNDIYWSSSNGNHIIGFDREADTLTNAIDLAIKDIEKANIGVEIIYFDINESME